jgi:putative nucleotidyltransferase with HDIG domain
MAGSENLVHIGREILKRLIATENNVGIYPPKHPAVVEPAVEMCEMLKDLFHDRDRVSFAIVNSEIYFERQLLSEESIRYADFIRLLMQRGVNSLSFDPNVTPESITVFFSFINIKGEDKVSGKSLKRLLKGADVKGVDFEELVAFDVTDEVYEVKSGPQVVETVANTSYEDALEQMEEVGEDVLTGKGIDVGSLHVVVSSLMGDFLTDREAIIGLLSIKSYNKHLFHHSINVAVTSLLIGSKLKLSEEMLQIVGISGLLHDIGKLKIPSEIIDKPEKLTDSEWEIMKTHPIEGAQILLQYGNIGEFPLLAAMEHHVHYDLNGYPTLNGKMAPHAIARIVAIADVYEAMTANRSYRPACSVHQAMGMLMSGAGTQFDSMLLKLLLNTIGVFPPGSLVRLRTGQTAIVVEANEGEPFSPKVSPVNPDTGVRSDKMVINTAENPVQYAVIGVVDSE